MSYNTASIRELLRDAFSDEEFTFFCYDHFHPVYENFTSTMPRLLKIHSLIVHCEKFNYFDELLTLVKNFNPVQYDKFISSINDPPQTATSTPNASPTTILGPTKQLFIQFIGELYEYPPERLNLAVGAFAAILGIPDDQITILSVRGGSIILEVEMPAEAAQRLIELYEANDPIIQDLGISRVTDTLEKSQDIPKKSSKISRQHPSFQKTKRAKSFFIGLSLKEVWGAIVRGGGLATVGSMVISLAALLLLQLSISVPDLPVGPLISLLYLTFIPLGLIVGNNVAIGANYKRSKGLGILAVACYLFGNNLGFSLGQLLFDLIELIYNGQSQPIADTIAVAIMFFSFSLLFRLFDLVFLFLFGGGCYLAYRQAA